jgi:hypothetical protein
MEIMSAIPELEYSEAKCWKSVYQHSKVDIRRKLKLAATEIAGATCLAAGGIDTLGFNRVVGLGIASAINGPVLDSVIHFYEQSETSRFFVQFPPFQLSPDIRQLLETKGFRYYNNWSKYFLDLRNLGIVAPHSTEFKVAPVKPDQLSLFGDIICRSFEFDPSLREYVTATYGAPGWKYYFALDEGKPVAAASLYFMDRHAKLVMGATLPEARNSGAQSLLITQRIEDAVSHKCQTISTETSQDLPERPSHSARNMQKFGFRLGYHRANYIYEF